MLFSNLIVSIVIALAFFFIAKKAYAIADREGTDFAGLSSIDIHHNDPLKVATFNIQTGKNGKGVRDIQTTAELISDQHIIGIQEIYAPGWLNKLGFGQSQLAALSAGKSFHSLMAATRRRWFREQRGNAVLSRLPINKWRIKGLPDYTGKSFRNMSICEFVWQNKPVVFINTHLHTSKGREEQLEIVLAEFTKHPTAILVGDFNSKRETPALTRALQEAGVNDAINSITRDNQDTANRIDWILTKGFNTVGGKIVDEGVSDHPYYEVSLTLVR